MAAGVSEREGKIGIGVLGFLVTQERGVRPTERQIVYKWSDTILY